MSKRALNLKVGTKEHTDALEKLRQATEVAEQKRMRKTFLVKSAESQIYKEIDEAIEHIKNVRIKK